MKTKLLIACLFFGLAASAQPAGYTRVSSRYEWLAGKFTALHLPAYGDTALQSGQYRGAGAVLIDTTGSNKGMYVWYDGYWHRVGLSGESAGISGGNLGAGFRYYVPGSSGIKTAFSGYGLSIDSATNTNGLTFILDTTTVFPQVRTTIPASRFGIEDVTTSVHRNFDLENKILTITDGAGIILESTRSGGVTYMTANNETVINSGNLSQLSTPGQRQVMVKPDTLRFDPPGGRLRFNSIPHQNSTANTLVAYDSLTGLVGHVAVGSIGGGGGTFNALTKEGLSKRSDTLVLDNNRNIYYITQPTTGSSIPSIFTAVGTPGLTFSSGTWIWEGNANNNTQYIRSNAGVLAEGSYIEGYVIIDSVRASSIGPGLVFKSYNPFSGGIYTHDVEFRYVTGSSATNYGKITIYGKTGNSTNVSDSARVANLGDTLYYRADRDGLAYTFRVENLTQDWKLYKTVQCTPNGSPFVPHNSSYVAFSPGGGGYKTYGFRYVVKAPIQTELCIVGNSITQGQGATAEGSRFASLIGNPVNNIVMGGGADGISEMLKRVGEIIAIKPKAVILEGPGNDVLFDGSLTTTTKNEYIEFRDSIVAHGIAFIHALVPPRTATDVSALKVWVDTLTTFRSDTKIDTWTPLLGSGTSLATKYDSDGTHFNDGGQAQYASTVNTGIHRFNNDGLYATKYVIANNGYVMGTDAGTGADQNKAGGLIARLTTSSGTYGMIGRASTYAYFNAMTESSSYDNIGLATQSSATPKVFIGPVTTPTAKLHIGPTSPGTIRALMIDHLGSFSAEAQETQVSMGNSGNEVARWAYSVGTGNMIDQLWYTYNSGMNTTPNIAARGNGKTAFNKRYALSTVDISGALRVSDSVLATGIATTLVDTTAYKPLVIDANGNVTKNNWAFAGSGGGGGSGTVTSVSAGLGMSFSTITSSGSVGVDTAVGTGVVMWPRLNKRTDSLIALLSTGTYINNQWGSQQNGRFWINGAGETDSSFRGRTTGAMNGFKTASFLAYSSSGRSSYAGLGYDATLNVGWLQALTESSAYRDFMINNAGGNLGLGVLSTAPSVLFHMKKTQYPAIRFEKTGVGSWYIGNRSESTGTDFMISSNTNDWIQIKTTGETGFGAQAPSAWVDIAAGTTGIGQLILRSGVVQSSPTSGAMTNVSGALKFYNGAQKRIPLTNDAAPSNGQIPIGNGTDYTAANITSTGGTITITNGSGTINIEGAAGTLVPLQDFYTSASNSGTSETDLYSFTVPTNTLTGNGQKIMAKYSGSFNDATGTETMKVYFGGTVIANIGGVSGNPANWNFEVMVMRSGATTARASVTFLSDGSFRPGITSSLTGLDFTATNIIKITGTSSQNVTDAIKADIGTVYWQGTIVP